MIPLPDPADDAAQAPPALAAVASVKNRPLVIRLVGIGGAGGNAVAHMARSDLQELRPVAIHTSARILESTQTPERILIGSDLTHGLGVGGDPSLARAAAEHDLPLLKALCQDVDLMFIVTGLGGGTATGVAPVLARVAREAGVLVVGVATLPFEIEGARRRRQAEQGLQEFKAAADAVICLSNQKIFRVVDEKTSVLESLKITNDLLAQGIRGIWQMLTRPGLIHIDFADLCAVLRDRHSESSFATVEAQGEGRAKELIEQLLASPLLEGAECLANADSVLVNLVGGPDLSMADVKRVMEEINRHIDNAQLVMGASVAEGFNGRLSLTLVASLRPSSDRTGAVPINGLNSTPSDPAAPAPLELDHRFFTPTPSQCGASRFGPPAHALPAEERDPNALPGSDANGKLGRSASRKLQQGSLPLQIIAKGRFEKSHPTMHRGEDLDVPTYVRRGMPLN
jgi:cell division protein FtsZ